MEREITIVVTDEEARRIDESVASGEYDSAGDYLHAALTRFTELGARPFSDEFVRQLIEEDEAMGGPDLDEDEVTEHLNRHFAELIAKRNAGA